jgi:hypothetical protein
VLALASTVITGSDTAGLMTIFYCLTMLRSWAGGVKSANINKKMEIRYDKSIPEVAELTRGTNRARHYVSSLLRIHS